MQEEFRGRIVSYSDGYPRVCWSKHPASSGRVWVHIHRVIAFEKYGMAIFGMHVHHLDGDRHNWSPDNLEILTPQEHGSLHSPTRNPPVEIKCLQCKEYFMCKHVYAHQRKYCDNICYGLSRFKIDWPLVEDLRNMVAERGCVGTGKALGVSDVAVRKHLLRETANG